MADRCARHAVQPRRPAAGWQRHRPWAPPRLRTAGGRARRQTLTPNPSGYPTPPPLPAELLILSPDDTPTGSKKEVSVHPSSPRHERWRHEPTNAGEAAAAVYASEDPTGRKKRAHVSVRPGPARQTDGRREIISVSRTPLHDRLALTTGDHLGRREGSNEHKAQRTAPPPPAWSIRRFGYYSPVAAPLQ